MAIQGEAREAIDWLVQALHVALEHCASCFLPSESQLYFFLRPSTRQAMFLRVCETAVQSC